MTTKESNHSTKDKYREIYDYEIVKLYCRGYSIEDLIKYCAYGLKIKKKEARAQVENAIYESLMRSSHSGVTPHSGQ